MRAVKLLRRLFSWTPGAATADRPTFRCLRCGAEFERQYQSCERCGASFVVEAD